MRWLYHIVAHDLDLAAESYAPASLAADGFLHASFHDAVRESARLHFPAGAALYVLQIDPRRLDARVELAATPRGPMPHIHGPIPRDAITTVRALDEFGASDALTTSVASLEGFGASGLRTSTSLAPDRVTGTHIGFVAFEGMTLLDLVGALDPLSRIASMGFDKTSRTTLIGATGSRVWSSEGAALTVDLVCPPLAAFDVVVVPGGFGTRTLQRDMDVIEWLAAFPHNRLLASVCSGALLLGAAGRLKGRRATTHRSSMAELPPYGATPVEARVVDEGQIVTAAGVTCALDLGLHLVRRLEGDEIADKIAAQMELPPGFAAARG